MLQEKKGHIRLNVRHSKTSLLKDLIIKLPDVYEPRTHDSSFSEGKARGRGQRFI